MRKGRRGQKDGKDTTLFEAQKTRHSKGHRRQRQALDKQLPRTSNRRLEYQFSTYAEEFFGVVVHAPKLTGFICLDKAWAWPNARWSLNYSSFVRESPISAMQRKANTSFGDNERTLLGFYRSRPCNLALQRSLASARVTDGDAKTSVWPFEYEVS